MMDQVKGFEVKKVVKNNFWIFGMSIFLDSGSFNIVGERLEEKVLWDMVKSEEELFYFLNLEIFVR